MKQNPHSNNEAEDSHSSRSSNPLGSTAEELERSKKPEPEEAATEQQSQWPCNVYTTDEDGTPKKLNAVHQVHNMGKMKVSKREKRVWMNYTNKYKLRPTRIRIDDNNRAYIWQSGTKLYMAT